MDYFIEELKNKKIINTDDIKTMQEYINKKYFKISSSEKAKMLSNTIHHILDTNLKELPESYRQAVKINTLKNAFSKNKASIFMYDVFLCCIKIEPLRKNFIKEITSWINANIENAVEEKDLNNYLGITNPKMNPVTDENLNNKITELVSPNKPIETTTAPTIPFKLKLNKKLLILSAIIFFILISQVLGQVFFQKSLFKTPFYIASTSESENSYLKDLVNQITLKNAKKNFPNVYLPEYLKYQTIDEDKLKSYLSSRNSLLGKDPYFSTIMSTAREFNLNPILLFAITGQEQDFVPVNTPSASKIANNPFNVYHSWQEYNTDIKDSSRIAARTIINLSENRPNENNPFMWIGKKYAEDSNWGNGVQAIFEEINNYFALHSKK
ncbi:hypothetical protein [Clostridium ljungdahlii]|uniref:Mannosyl-glycoprotein endo-beta-N-acetylglucosaminidase n=1 Tax=Clostridium ljungdahlii TaxID=1538 RepID=A0A166SB34_9CLOT|nr:hypothetical protein [Clostridium ljungdahlii]OAA91928.1 hypothetical protein WY13_00330 [Clostridium ljungdahlii]